MCWLVYFYTLKFFCLAVYIYCTVPSTWCVWVSIYSCSHHNLARCLSGILDSHLTGHVLYNFWPSSVLQWHFLRPTPLHFTFLVLVPFLLVTANLSPVGSTHLGFPAVVGEAVGALVFCWIGSSLVGADELVIGAAVGDGVAARDVFVIVIQ